MSNANKVIYDFPRIPENEELFCTKIDWENEEKNIQKEIEAKIKENRKLKRT